MGLRDVAIAGVYATRQARRLDTTTTSACLEAIRGAIADAGMEKGDIDGMSCRWNGPGGTVLDPGSADWVHLLGIHTTWVDDTYPGGVPGALHAAAAISAGLCTTAVVAGGVAGTMREQASAVAPWTRPANEFVEPFGGFTLAHFALVAARYLHEFDVPRDKLAAIAATIRNAGSENPDAILHGRGPFTVDDILGAPLVAEPFTRLECCLASEGAAAMVLTSVERARDCPNPPVAILGGGLEWWRQQYVEPPRYEEVGRLGVNAARRAFAMAGLTPADVSLASFYDVNTYEVARQLEVCGFCDEGEGAEFAAQIGIGRDGGLPINPDGGGMAYSHPAWCAVTLRVIEAVKQLRGQAEGRQVPEADVAIVTGAGSGPQYGNVMLLGRA
jgi:acetyl-CoA acetyltransferase